MITDEMLRRANDIRIECATEPAVSRNDNQQDSIFRPYFQQWMRYVFNPCCEISQDRLQLRGVRPRAEDSLLGTTQFRGGNSL
jgi:hypothetical protein